MDYGRLAYLKAEEVEKYVRGIAKSENMGAAACVFRPNTALESGYETALYGSGAIALAVNISVSAPSGAENIRVWLYCGDKNIDYANVTLAAGSGGEYTFLCCAYPDSDGEKLGVKAESSGLLLNELRLLAIGDGVTLSHMQSACKCDCVGLTVYLAREEDGEITLAKIPDGGKVNVAHGTVFDLSAHSSGADVICRDDNGNLWGVGFDGNLNETARIFIDGHADKLALGRTSDGLSIAALSGGEVFLAECGECFSGMTEWQSADFGSGFGDVFFCRQSGSKVLFLQKGNRVYAKLPAPEFKAKDCIAFVPQLII